MKKKNRSKKLWWIIVVLIIALIVLGVFVFDVPGLIKTADLKNDLEDFLVQNKYIQEADESLYFGGKNYKINNNPVYIFELRKNEKAKEHSGKHLGSFAVSTDKSCYFYHVPADKSPTGLPMWEKLN